MDLNNRERRKNCRTSNGKTDPNFIETTGKKKDLEAFASIRLTVT